MSADPDDALRFAAQDRVNRILATALVAAATCVKLYLGGACALLADEAYFWLWSRHLDFGYFDQPPLIAGTIRLGTALFGDTEIGVRVVAVLCTLAIVPLLWWVDAPIRLAVAWIAVPLLGWWTGFATPDAPLLACWAVGLYGVLRGGNGWLLAGAAAGLAFESKYTGAALLPLSILAVRRDELRDWRPWAGLALAFALAAPNLIWNAGNDWVTFRFQLREGLLADTAPGLPGLVEWLGGQVGLTAGVALVAVGWVVRADRADRSQRVLLATSVPLLLGFGVASTLAPAEVYWADVAWIAVIVALSGPVGRRIERATELALGMAILFNGIVVLHVRSPLWRLPDDPAAELTRGPVVAGFVASWAVPTAVDGHATPAPVLTQRYQEAAWIEFYARVPARRWPACGRADQFDLWPPPEKPASGVFVRPWDVSSRTCIDTDYPQRSPEYLLLGWDLAGRHVGDWELYELAQPEMN